MRTLITTVSLPCKINYQPPSRGGFSEDSTECKTWKTLAKILNEYHRTHPGREEACEAAYEICRGAIVTLNIQVYSDGTIQVI